MRANFRTRHTPVIYLTGLTDDDGKVRGFVSGGEAAVETLQDAARSHLPVSLVVLDVDNFQGRNDRQGHAAGDEFVLLLPATAEPEATLLTPHAGLMPSLGHLWEGATGALARAKQAGGNRWRGRDAVRPPVYEPVEVGIVLL